MDMIRVGMARIQAIQLMHYTDAQLAAKVRALFAPPPGFIPLAQVGELT